VLDVLMSDETNPRSLDFQLSHSVELYEKLPRHLHQDLQAMRDQLAALRAFDLREFKYALPDAPPTKGPASPTVGLSQLEHFLRGLERLLPTWSNNLSGTYFSHARTLPITIGQ
jgi:uncharacterized alpha-E superfamily protein